MSRESKCEHDIAEQETAVAEHLCPLCLDMKVIELKALRKANINLWLKEQTRRQAAEARLEAVRGLKRMEIKATHPHEVLFADGWNSLHDELEALLK